MKHTKIAIIGAGAVGSTTAYALLLKNIVPEIVLVDTNEIRCTGEVLDLSDVIPFSKASNIKKGSMQEAVQCDIIIIAAGARQKSNQSRLDLLTTNKSIIQSICNDLTPINPDAIVIVVTNPVDIMTYHAQQCLPLPKNQVFGSGTLLDTQRLRGMLSSKIYIAEQSIDAYMLGEHGDTQFAYFSQADIAGNPLINFAAVKDQLGVIEQEVKNQAQEIIKCKDATYFGVATVVAVLCEAIIYNQKLIVPISCFQEQFDVCLSMPAVLGERGIEKMISIPFSDEEQQKLVRSVQTLKKLL